MPVRVLVVDDSALVRKLLTEILAADPDIDVVGTAVDPFDAREKIKSLNPDVLTLDVEMPKMDGITFLRNLMRLRPLPVVMISSLTERGADVTLQALELGAVDFLAKPKLGVAEGLSRYAEEIIGKVKVAATARVRPLDPARTPVGKGGTPRTFNTTDRLVAIGASTGGTEAVADILQNLPPDSPGIVITQHIPEVFSARFAERLNTLCPLQVREAKDGDPILIGHALVAPGNFQLRVVRSGAKYLCKVTQDAPVNRHRPSVDVLFASVAEAAGANALGILLTGMGADGAEGLLTLLRAGAHTIAQDKATSVVWGMPGEAVRRGAAREVRPLPEVAAQITGWFRQART